MPSPVAAVVVLTDDERAQLQAWARRPKSAQALALRSRIVLAAADGLGNTTVAAKLGITVTTARKWRSRFVADRLDGLTDEPRPGRPRTVSDEQVEAVITRTLESTPSNATHWSTRSMGAELGLSQSAVSRIWRAFALQPAPAGLVEAEQGPVIHRQGPRRRRPVPEPARAGRGAVRG